MRQPIAGSAALRMATDNAKPDAIVPTTQIARPSLIAMALPAISAAVPKTEKPNRELPAKSNQAVKDRKVFTAF